jgi:hypothetical protein
MARSRRECYGARVRRRATGSAVLCALFLGACPNDQPGDPLDPDLLVELAEAGGDGRGEALTGRYLTAATVLDCDCPQRMGVDLCGGGTAQLIGLDGPAAVVQTGGWLTFTPEAALLPWALSGAVERDRSFVIAGVSALAVGLFTIRLHARVDGEFDAQRRLDGELAHRLLGELPDGPVDCRATYALHGEPVPGA